jgi:hypothetical protein
MKRCEVSKAVHHRGYGTPEEIVPVDTPPRSAWTFNGGDYLGLRSTRKERDSQ